LPRNARYIAPIMRIDKIRMMVPSVV
jgi:hypothetical protein